MKYVALLGIIILVVAGCTVELPDEPVGSSCSTVSPDSRDDCCVRQMEGKPIPLCVGRWVYDVNENECSFVCGEIVGDSCGTVTPGYNDECCERKMADVAHDDCDGDWIYDFDAAECTYKCIIGEPVNIEEQFCGTSTEFPCDEDGDCVTGGCSGQICMGKAEEGGISTCEFRECYRAENYGLRCQCIASMCMWQ